MMILLVILVLGGYALYTMTPGRTDAAERAPRGDGLARAGRGGAAARGARTVPRRAARANPLAARDAGARRRQRARLPDDGLGRAPSRSRSSRWGASFGPRTTNGEWWRLVASMFVHTGTLPAPRELRRPRAARADPRAPRRPHHVRRRLRRRGSAREPREPVGLSDGRQRRRVGRHLRPLRSPPGVVGLDGDPSRASRGGRAAARLDRARSGSATSPRPERRAKPGRPAAGSTSTRRDRA